MTSAPEASSQAPIVSTITTRETISTYPNVWIIILVVVVILVQLLQEVGLYIARKTDKRRVIS
jgi:ABC-type methionine transport system permease subunit